MATIIRPELSKDNPYYISRHRYYELKHFCMQYPEWKRIYNDLCSKTQPGIIELGNNPKPDESLYVRERYLNNINLVEECANLTDKTLYEYILKGVTEGHTYNYFRAKYKIPCCKDIYYELYRKFFYILSHKKIA